MSKLLTQLKWSRFVCVLKRLGYQPFTSAGGSARTFHKPGGDPDLVTFHQPHGSDTIRLGTLTEYIRRLQASRDAFLANLEHC